MKERILDLLVCPACHRKLSLQIFLREDGEVKEGLLKCPCGQWFPIMNSVPRLLLGEYRGNYEKFLKTYRLEHLKRRTNRDFHSDPQGKQVQKSFGTKWMSQPSWGITGETKVFMEEWLLRKYGWENQKVFKKSLSQRKTILDAGAGLGRVMIDFCKASENGEIFGVELSDTVEAAYQNTKEYPNANIIQADILKLPFKKRIFDFIFSEGVLHHTPDTKKAFKALLGFLTPKGEIAIYVYKKKGPIREFCDDYIRRFTTGLTEKECWAFSRKVTRLGKALSDLHIEFEIPEDIPVLEMKAGRYNLQRFFYYHFFKSFWNDRFTFDENNLINFDWYHPVHAWRHSPEEVKGWIKEHHLNILWWHEEESGMTFRCQKR